MQEEEKMDVVPLNEIETEGGTSNQTDIDGEQKSLEKMLDTQTVQARIANKLFLFNPGDNVKSRLSLEEQLFENQKAIMEDKNGDTEMTQDSLERVSLEADQGSKHGSIQDEENTKQEQVGCLSSLWKCFRS